MLEFVCELPRVVRPLAFDRASSIAVCAENPDQERQGRLAGAGPAEASGRGLRSHGQPDDGARTILAVDERSCSVFNCYGLPEGPEPFRQARAAAPAPAESGSDDAEASALPPKVPRLSRSTG